MPSTISTLLTRNLHDVFGENDLEGPIGGTPEVAGTDFIIVGDGRIAAVYLFFDELSRS